MKPNVLLTIASLLNILFITFHLSDEIARGMEPGRANMVIPMIVLAGWLYGTLVLAGRRSGYIIMLLGGIIGTGIPIVHMVMGGGLVGGRIAVDSSGAFFWTWQNMALAMTAIFSVSLAIRCLWNPEWGQSRWSGDPDAQRPDTPSK